MTKYKVEVSYRSFFNEYATTLEYQHAHTIAQRLEKEEGAKSVRIMKIETTESQIYRVNDIQSSNK